MLQPGLPGLNSERIGPGLKAFELARQVSRPAIDLSSTLEYPSKREHGDFEADQRQRED